MTDKMLEQEARDKIKEAVKEYYLNFHKPAQESYKAGDKISYASRVFDENEMMSLTDALLDFWLTSGRFNDQLEKSLCEYLDVKYALTVNSGSSANLLAFMALTDNTLGERQIKRGDEIITVACGFPTTISPILQYGAVPVFIDVTLPKYNIDTSRLEEALSEKTKAVMLAHTLGNPFNIKIVKSFCDKHNLWLIEDNCDALGSKYTLDGVIKLTGTFGDIGTSSFYPAHHITTGEGGAVYTNNPQLYKIMKSLRDWGRDCVCPAGVDNMCKHRFTGQFGELPQGYDHKYVYSRFGYNLKMTDLQASIGCEQIKKIDEFVSKRKLRYKLVRNMFVKYSDYFILPEPEENSSPSWFGVPITVKEKAPFTRNELVQYFEENNIQTRMLFGGNLIKHPCFDSIRDTEAYRVVGPLDNSDIIMNNTFWLGVYPGLKWDMIVRISEILDEFIENKIKN